MNLQSTHSTKIFFVMAAALIVGTSCQPQKTVDTPTNPTVTGRIETPPVVPVSTPVPLDSVVSECNGFTAGSTSGKVMTYYSVTGAYDANRVRIRLSQMPNEFYTSDNAYVEFYRWKVANNGTAAYIDPTQLKFELIYRKTGASVGSFGVDKLDAEAFTAIQKSFGSTANIADYDIILSGTSFEYQVVRVGVKKSVGSTTDAVIAEGDFLIPAYTANPNSYATTHSAALAKLHPLNSRKSETWTSADFKGIVDSMYCFTK